MRRLSWSQVKAAKEPGLALELRLVLELLRVLPNPKSGLRIALGPSNILVADDGSVTVGAQGLGREPTEQRYLAPEVDEAGSGEVQAAIYSVGALLFEAITGNPFESAQAVQQEAFGSRALAKAAGLGAQFWEIYLLEAAAKATHPDAKKRWASAHEFAKDLQRVANERIASRSELGVFVALVAQALQSRVKPSPAPVRPSVRAKSASPVPSRRPSPPPGSLARARAAKNQVRSRSPQSGLAVFAAPEPAIPLSRVKPEPAPGEVPRSEREPPVSSEPAIPLSRVKSEPPASAVLDSASASARAGPAPASAEDVARHSTLMGIGLAQLVPDERLSEPEPAVEVPDPVSHKTLIGYGTPTEELEPEQPLPLVTRTPLPASLPGAFDALAPGAPNALYGEPLPEAVGYESAAVDARIVPPEPATFDETSEPGASLSSRPGKKSHVARWLVLAVALLSSGAVALEYRDGSVTRWVAGALPSLWSGQHGSRTGDKGKPGERPVSKRQAADAAARSGTEQPASAAAATEASPREAVVPAPTLEAAALDAATDPVPEPAPSADEVGATEPSRPGVCETCEKPAADSALDGATSPPKPRARRVPRPSARSKAGADRDYGI